MVVTNATVTSRLEEISSFPPELLKHLFFKFSYHYLELKKRGLLDMFFSNILMMSNAGCSFTLEVTPSDELIPYIEDVKSCAIENLGAIPHVTIARDESDPKTLPMLTKLSREDYIKTWSAFDSELFRYKERIFGEKRREFCYAGDWSFYLNLATGEMSQCYNSLYRQNIFENPEKPIKFRPIGHCCQEHHCYNGHSFLTFGDIPELETPVYSQMRDRVCPDGSRWVGDEMRCFLDSKLSESNQLYSDSRKKKIDRINRRTAFMIRCKKLIKRILRK